jgi:hypothetical protein
MSNRTKEWLQIVGVVLIGIFVIGPVLLGIDIGLRISGVYDLIEMAFYGFLSLLVAWCVWMLILRPALEVIGVLKP